MALRRASTRALQCGKRLWLEVVRKQTGRPVETVKNGTLQNGVGDQFATNLHKLAAPIKPRWQQQWGEIIQRRRSLKDSVVTRFYEQFSPSIRLTGSLLARSIPAYGLVGVVLAHHGKQDETFGHDEICENIQNMMAVGRNTETDDIIEHVPDNSTSCSRYEAGKMIARGCNAVAFETKLRSAAMADDCNSELDVAEGITVISEGDEDCEEDAPSVFNVEEDVPNMPFDPVSDDELTFEMIPVDTQEVWQSEKNSSFGDSEYGDIYLSGSGEVISGADEYHDAEVQIVLSFDRDMPDGPTVTIDEENCAKLFETESMELIPGIDEWMDMVALSVVDVQPSFPDDPGTQSVGGEDLLFETISDCGQLLMESFIIAQDVPNMPFDPVSDDELTFEMIPVDTQEVRQSEKNSSFGDSEYGDIYLSGSGEVISGADEYHDAEVQIVLSFPGDMPDGPTVTIEEDNGAKLFETESMELIPGIDKWMDMVALSVVDGREDTTNDPVSKSDVGDDLLFETSLDNEHLVMLASAESNGAMLFETESMELIPGIDKWMDMVALSVFDVQPSVPDNPAAVSDIDNDLLFGRTSDHECLLMFESAEILDARVFETDSMEFVQEIDLNMTMEASNLFDVQPSDSDNPGTQSVGGEDLLFETISDRGQLLTESFIIAQVDDDYSKCETSSIVSLSDTSEDDESAPSVFNIMEDVPTQILDIHFEVLPDVATQFLCTGNLSQSSTEGDGGDTDESDSFIIIPDSDKDMQSNTAVSLDDGDLSINAVSKISFNCAIASNAHACTKSSEKEALPTKMAALNRLLDVWENGYHFRMTWRNLPTHPNIVDIHPMCVEDLPLYTGENNEYSQGLPAHVEDGECRKDKTMLLIMKRYETTLKRFVKSHQLSSDSSCMLLLQLLEGVLHMSEHGITHPGLRSDVLLIENGDFIDFPQLLISDFDSSLVAQSLKTPAGETSQDGEMNWKAPERKSATSGDNSFDMMAVGGIAYEIFGMQNPFETPPDCSQMLRPDYSDEDLPELLNAPLSVQNLVRKTLHQDLKERPDARLAADMMQIIMWGPKRWQYSLPCKKDILSWLVVMAAEVHLRKAAIFESMELQMKKLFLFRLDFDQVLEAIYTIHDVQD